MSNYINTADRMAQLYWEAPGFIGYKSPNLDYLWANRQLTASLGFSSVDELTNLTDFDIRCKAVNYADIYQQQDHYAIKHQSHIAIDVLCYADDCLHILYTKKKPIYFDGKLDGVMFIALELDSSLLGRLMSLLLQDKKFSPVDNELHMSFMICDHYNVGEFEQLSERETMVLFYLLHGLTAKEIGARLLISNKTVESHVENIKIKLNCVSRSDLFCQAHAMGFLKQVPKAILARLTCLRLS